VFKKILALIILSSISLVVISGCAQVTRSKITIKGSDTMVIMVQRLAEEYMSSYKDKVIQVTGGGSGIGIAALINKTTDIAMASRAIKGDEIKAVQKSWNRKPKEIKVALDGITIYVNEANPIREITLSQLKDIYTGEITNWKDLGWEDYPIVVYTRENNSGTYVFFKEHVIQNQDYTNKAQSMPGTGSIVNAIAREKYSIGYGGIAYAKGVKTLQIKKDPKSSSYLPTEENIKKNIYPISRFLYMYTCEYEDPEVKSFLDWTLSPSGQKLVKEVGYFPVN